MMKIILDKNDYWIWEGNYIHNSITNLMKLDKYETKSGLPLFVSKRVPDGKWGYCDSKGNDVWVHWK